ncbi:hypothetical protein MYSTI_07567 [Myxococcus stipitatus DSM 14675]|uniref:Uncharacterized protein n=1 Tax=Myxococcus stipitatus (strain DSM 14675 / JCM 12634 / Mx s8) TaxID=1278073 RepID=L7UQJ8_MYXSD|nr:hypothetical protein [Myxococcus stipitatus]AGC48839.1 hypothetical protein MYSTI_07567 [Myxococcus stipitatus DSM 14675]
MRRKLIVGMAVFGVALLGGGYWAFRAYQRAMAQVGESLALVDDGVRLEPVLTQVAAAKSEPAERVAASESWSSEEDDMSSGETRLEAALTPGADASHVSVELIHVGVDTAWEPTQRFQLLADGKAVKVSFPKEDSPYEARVLRGGSAFEEHLSGTVSAADLKRFATARRAQVRVGQRTVTLSPKDQAVFQALLE